MCNLCRFVSAKNVAHMCFVCIVLGELNKLICKVFLHRIRKTFNLLFFSHQKITIFSHSFLLSDRIEPVILCWEIYPSI